MTGHFTQRWLPVLSWIAVIVFLSSIPRDQIPSVPIPKISSIVHFFEYSVLGALMMRGFVLSLPARKTLLLSILAGTFTILFAISDEWYQNFVPGRHCDLEDIVVDSISAILGILLYIRHRKH